MIERLNPEQFTWNRWLAGSPHTFFIPCREPSLTCPQSIKILRKHAVGFCNSEEVLCRPKKDHMAVMFFHNENHFWFHLRRREFNRIFGGYENDRSIERNWILYS